MSLPPKIILHPISTGANNCGSFTGISSSRSRAVSRSPAAVTPVITAFQENMFLSGIEWNTRRAPRGSPDLKRAVMREL
nr:unnamed protein product [Digitaria exilis]